MNHVPNGNDGYYSPSNYFKSEGEKKIAKALEDLGIRYVYEPGVLINDSGKQRIWYPDFGLTRYAVFLEYFGRENDPAYDARTQYKLDIYRRNEIEVVPLYPETLKKDYGKYVLNEINRVQYERNNDLEKRISGYHHRQKFKTNHLFRGYRGFPTSYR